MAWDPEQLTEQTNDLLNATAQNDPTQFPWGFFAYGDAPAAIGGGIGCFQWFGSLAELLSFISDHSAASYLTFDEEAEWLELRDQLRAITAGFASDPDGTMAQLNQELKSLMQVEWIGTYETLCIGTDEFPRKVREWFREQDDDCAENQSPITSGEEPAFRERITEYGL